MTISPVKCVLFGAEKEDSHQVASDANLQYYNEPSIQFSQHRLRGIQWILSIHSIIHPSSHILQYQLISPFQQRSNLSFNIYKHICCCLSSANSVCSVSREAVLSPSLMVFLIEYFIYIFNVKLLVYTYQDILQVVFSFSSSRTSQDYTLCDRITDQNVYLLFAFVKKIDIQLILFNTSMMMGFFQKR